MRVLVVREYVSEDVRDGTVDGDIRFIMIARTDTMNMVSPVVTLVKEGWRCNGNPYGIYGDACAKFAGIDKFSLSIDVAECTSGDLEGWS